MDFYKWLFYLRILLNSLILCRNLQIFNVRNMVSASDDSFIASFPVSLLLLFSCLTSVRISNTTLNRRVLNACVDFKENDSSVCLLRTTFAFDYSVKLKTSSLPNLPRVLNMNECGCLSVISCVYWVDQMVLLPNLLRGFIVLTDLSSAKKSLCNSTWSKCSIFSIYCWIIFTHILFRTFASILTDETGLCFFLVVTSLSSFGTEDVHDIEWVVKCSLFFWCLEVYIKLR